VISGHCLGLCRGSAPSYEGSRATREPQGNEHQPADADTALLAVSRSGIQVADLRTLTPEDLLTAWPVSATEGDAP